MISLLTTPLVYAESDTAEEKAAQEEMYEAYGQLCFGGKNALKTIGFLSLPKDDAKSLAPINWVEKLGTCNINLAARNCYSSSGPGYLWKHGDIQGSLNIATFPSPTEAQIRLAGVLRHLPVKLSKGIFNGQHAGDICFHGTSNIYFVRRNFFVDISTGIMKEGQLVNKNDKYAQVLALNHLAETIDKIILTSTVLLKETVPFQVTLSKEWFNINEKVNLITIPQKNNRSFTVRCEQINGTSKIEGQLWTPKLKINEAQTCTFEAKNHGDGTLKVYVCEKSGMVWTCYIRFNVFHGN